MASDPLPQWELHASYGYSPSLIYSTLVAPLFFGHNLCWLPACTWCSVHCACYYIALPPLDPNTILLVGVQAVHFSSYCAPLPPSCKASALRCSPEEEEQSVSSTCLSLVIFWFIYNPLVLIVVVGGDLLLVVTYHFLPVLASGAKSMTAFSHARCLLGLVHSNQLKICF